MAERLTAFSEFSDEVFVDPVQQAAYVYSRMMELGPSLQEALLDANLAAAFFYEHLLSLTRKLRSLSVAMRTDGYLTYGLDDMLASTANELETLVYFLERRSQMAPPIPSPAPMTSAPAPTTELTPIPVAPPALVFGPRGV
jgi:hypothetical protein